MVRNKLDELKQEIAKYIGIPYFINLPPRQLNKPEPVLVGKGSAKDIALKTIELANCQNLKLTNLTTEEIYNFQKKNQIGIDCSGFASNLLNFILGSNVLPVTQTSANALTSEPLSIKVPLTDIQTADLVRQNNGHHLLFIIEKTGNIIYYVDSSFSGRGVHYGNFNIADKNFKYNGIFRLKQFS
jgi:hypothetical protein